MEWTTFQYEGSGNYLSQYTDSTRDLPVMNPGAGFLYVFQYDNSRDLQNIVASNGLWNFHLNELGMIATDTIFSGVSSIYSTDSFYYNSSGEVAGHNIFNSTGTFIGYHLIYSYDQSGNIAQTVIFDSTTNELAKDVTDSYQYDTMPNPLFAIKYIGYTKVQNALLSISPHNIVSFQRFDSSGNLLWNISNKILYTHLIIQNIPSTVLRETPPGFIIIKESRLCHKI